MSSSSSSKKKSSTMTLKDFHGGSIPSDLPLPSAPGGSVVVRPTSSSDHRSTSGTSQLTSNPWGANHHHHTIGTPNTTRSDLHYHFRSSRPGSSGSMNNNRNNNFDEKPSFYPPHNIGRNFDEDERKPLDGVSVPRRTVSDEPTAAIRGVSVQQQPTKPVSPSRHYHPVNANPVRFSASGSSGSSVVPNAWGTTKKEVVSEPVVVHSSSSSTWSGPNAVSRFAQASALEKISSGRWQSKPSTAVVSHQQQPDVQVIRFSDDTDKVYNTFTGDFEGMRGGRYGDEIVRGVKVVSPEMYHRDGVRPASSESKMGGGGSQVPITVPAEVERPKIKLLPRSKPLESSEPPIMDYKQGYRPPSSSGPVETVNEPNACEILSKPGSAGSDEGQWVVERPRLNLKPRSQTLEKSEGIAEKERKALFGGARPRELVLKERGVDDDVINNLDVIQPPNRVKHDQPTETKPEPVISSPVYGDRAENFLHDQKIGKNSERKDNRADPDRTEQRGSWRNENWRNSREPEKQQQQERRPEPETWRKPEQPNSPPPDAAGLRYGKAASAMELAQAFSRSNSGPKTADRVSGQRGLPGRNQIPFSRLTDTREFYSSSTPRRQINGY